MNISIAVTMSKVSGDNQQATLNTTLRQPLIVKVSYTNGTGVNGVPISFSITSQPQGAQGTNLSANQVMTNAHGTAFVTLRLGNKPGQYQVTASHPNLTSVIFTVVALSLDSSPPAAIPSLQVNDIQSTSITLTWTAPGDDGNAWTAYQYDIRYSTSQITEATWGNATQCVGEPQPAPAGQRQDFIVTGLQPYTRYYFAMKTSDEVPNWSGLSNVVVGTTAPKIDIIQVTPPNDNISFTTRAPENRILCVADIKPDSLDITYNSQIEWEIDDDPRDQIDSGDPLDPERGNTVTLTITAPQTPNGRTAPLSYRIRAFVIINNATYTSAATYTTQDNRDGLRQEYIDVERNGQRAGRVPNRNEFDQDAPAYPRLLDRRQGYEDICAWHQWWILRNLNQNARNLDNAYTGSLFPTSGYRCPVENPGAVRSYHLFGQAMDFAQGNSLENYNVAETARRIGGTSEIFLYDQQGNRYSYYEGFPRPPNFPLGVTAWTRGHIAW